MIKNLLTAGLLLSGLIAIKAQEMVKVSGNLEAAPIDRSALKHNLNKTSGVNAVPDNDELFYFYNKHYYRNTNANANSFPTAKMPQPPTYSLTGVGSSFLNTGGATITVEGGSILASRQANSTSTAVPVRLYIWSAGPTGVPGTKLDSAMTAPVTNTLGSVYTATFTNPVVVTGAFFMSYKSIPSAVTDTIRTFLTSGFTPTSTGGAGWAAPLKFGEGLGYIKGGTSWGVTTNAFGSGTELEPIVLPMVAFSYTANGTQMAPNGGTVSATGYCANAPITFTNTSGNVSIIENRQFNWNAFAPAWAPFVNTPTSTPVADPIYNWSFTGPAPAGNYTTTNASHTYGVAGTNASANLIVKYQHGSGDGTKTQDIKTFPTFTVVNCGLVGISVNSLNSGLSIYPNPVVNGKATISGLEGSSVVSIYNMLGQMVSTQTSDKETVTIDLSSQVQGTYLLRISDSNNKAKTIKIINQ